MENLQLAKIANQVRKDIVTGVYNAKSGHPGGSLSAADMLTFLYFEEMNVSPEKAKDSNRDRFVLSKGHVAAFSSNDGYTSPPNLRNMLTFLSEY